MVEGQLFDFDSITQGVNPDLKHSAVVGSAITLFHLLWRLAVDL